MKEFTVETRIPAKIMSWKTSKFASSLISLFIDAAPDTVEDRRIEAVRDAMLSAIADLTQTSGLDTITRRLRWAPHAQSLWYLRIDVMTLLSAQLGESEAHRRLRDVTQRFRGLVPSAQISRPSRLNRH